MKNVVRILFTIITIITLFCVTQPAVCLADESYGIDANKYDPMNAEDPNVDTDVVSKYVAPVYDVLQYALILAAIISLTIVGLKIILGSVQQKAEYKQHLVPIVVGVCLAALIFTVLKVLLKLAGIF